MLCLADRNFFSYNLWKQAQATEAQLLWRVKKNLILPCLKRFRDGSYLSKIYASTKDRRHDKNGIDVRVIEYNIDGIPDPEPVYRLVTSILNPRMRRPKSWPLFITSAGRLRLRLMNSKRICVGRKLFCAANARSWLFRSSTAL